MGEIGLQNTNVGGGFGDNFKGLIDAGKDFHRSASEMSNVGKQGYKHAKYFKKNVGKFREVDTDSYNRMLDKSNIGFVEKGFHKLVNWGGNALINYLKRRNQERRKRQGGSLVGGAMELHANEFLRNNGYKTTLNDIEKLPHYDKLINAYSKGGSVNVRYNDYKTNLPNTYQAPYEKRASNMYILP